MNHSNPKPISKARSGDLVYADRGLYRHYGVYDNGNVIDISPMDGNNALRNKQNAEIRKRPLADFLNGNPGYVDNSPGFHSRRKTLQRARQALGTGKNSYSLVFNNCEHIAREFQTGHKQSKQVDDAVETGIDLIGRILDFFNKKD